MKRAAYHNLGCKVNSYELDVMKELLEKKGYETVPFDREADIYVINTCTVTNIADRKSRQMLHRAKKRSPGAVVIAVGCYVETDRDRVRTDPAIDLAIGNNRKGQIVELLEEFLRAKPAGGIVFATCDTAIDEQDKVATTSGSFTLTAFVTFGAYNISTFAICNQTAVLPIFRFLFTTYRSQKIICLFLCAFYNDTADPAVADQAVNDIRTFKSHIQCIFNIDGHGKAYEFLSSCVHTFFLLGLTRRKSVWEY